MSKKAHLFGSRRGSKHEKLAAARDLLARGIVQYHQGDYQKAARLTRSAAAADPANAGASYLLGLLALREGDREAASGSLRRAVELAPDNAHYRHDLAGLLEEAGHFEEALTHLKAAALQHADRPEPHYRLGRLLYLMGRTAEAVPALTNALRAQPDHVEALYLRAVALVAAGDLAAARTAFLRVVELLPDQAEVHHNLGILAAHAGEWEAALDHYRAGLALAPADPGLNLSLGMALQQMGDWQAAKSACEEALRLGTCQGEAHCELGHIHAAAGGAAAAEEAYRLALLHGVADGYLGLAAIHALDATEAADIARMEAWLQRQDLAEEALITLHFTLGGLLDQRGETRAAFAHYAEGNRLKRRTLPYDRAAYTEYVDRISATFTREVLERRMGKGAMEGPRPVFVVGRPRAGVNLVGRILGSHPEAATTGERPYFAQRAGRLQDPATGAGYPECCASLSGQRLQELADGYRQAAAGCLQPAARILLNTAPLHYEHLGLLTLTFPNARIIHCRRQAPALMLSGFFQLHAGGHAYAYDLDDLAHHYHEYERLMAHWQRVLPLRLHHVDYEGLVRDQETVTRRLLSYCDLPFDPQCLAFHTAPGVVPLASAWGLRQPLFTTAVDRWRRYEEFLAPVTSPGGSRVGPGGGQGEPPLEEGNDQH